MTKAREVSATPETILVSGTVTAAAELNISNYLSDSYKFYNFVYYGTGTSPQITQLRFRENTTNVTTSYATNVSVINTSGNAVNWGTSTNQSHIVLGRTSGSKNMCLELKFFRPNATEGQVYVRSYDMDGIQFEIGGGWRTGMTNFNGFNINQVSGTMTGYYILSGIRA